MQRILICEDDPAVASIASRILDLSGYDVVVVDAATKALDLLSGQKNFDLLLTDLILPPPMSGIELINRATAQKPSLPAILMTGYAFDDADLERKKPANLVVLQKPIRMATLKETVKAMLNPRSGQSSIIGG